MNLSFCESLREIPYLSRVLNLESLMLDNCTSLVEVHQFVGFLNKLVTLSLILCVNLRKLPNSFKLKSLSNLYPIGCSRLQNFLEIEKQMECLETIYLEGASLKDLPMTIENLVGLRSLHLDLCKKLEYLPSMLISCKILSILVSMVAQKFETFQSFHQVYCILKQPIANHWKAFLNTMTRSQQGSSTLIWSTATNWL